MSDAKIYKCVDGVDILMTAEEVEQHFASLPDLLEVKKLRIREERNNLLQETDWIVIKSYERGENIPAQWELYRQALRDITAQADFPYSVEWPSKPE